MQLKKPLFNLSSLLSRCREYIGLQSKATFWFGAVLSWVQQNERKQLVDDTSVGEKVEIIKMLSVVLAAVSAFYQQERPNTVYKLLTLAGKVLELLQNCHEYHYIVTKVNYLNTLALYAIKTHQYSYCLDVFGEILDLYNQKVIDNASQFFLSAFSNYLSFLKRASKHLTSRMLEVQTILQDLFFKFFTKLMLLQNAPSQAYLASVTLITAVYQQNSVLLARFEKDLNSLINHIYQGQMKLKRRLPEDMVDFVMKEKVRRGVTMRITVNEDELRFYSTGKHRAHPLVQKRGEQEQGQSQLSKIQAMLSQSIEMLQEQKISSVRYATLEPKTEDFSLRFSTFKPLAEQSNLRVSNVTNVLSPIQSLQVPRSLLEQSDTRAVPSSIQPLQSLKPLTRTLTRKREMMNRQPKPMASSTRHTKIKFKIFSIFIEVNEDGVLLSDYTNENKRYIEWNTLSLIIQKIDLQFPMQEFLKIPMENYYDFVRVISFYLKKNDNREICLLNKPVPLLQVNQLIRLYKQEGKYLKLALMNQYDTLKFVGVLDLYLSQYSEFFKTLTENEYINYLNQRISSKNAENPYDRESVYHIDYLKRKRETTVSELSNQLKADSLQVAIEEKGCLYKCVFLLKNNIQLLVRLIDNIKHNTNLDDYLLEIKIQDLNYYGNSTFYLQSDHSSNAIKNFSDRINKTIQVPLERFTHYFPLNGQPLKSYISENGRMIVDCLNNFQYFSKEVNLGGLAFNITTHVSRTEMIEYGKYFSVVSAELVGSEERIWALLIRFYDLAYLKDSVTVMMNPYNDFLKHVIKGPHEDQMQILRNLLIGESVRETVNWLKKAGKLDKRINLFEYLYANKLI